MSLRAPVMPVLAFMLMAGCGGGGGGGPTEPGPGITFSAPAATANSLSLRRGTGSSATVLVVEVVATQVTDLYGVAFDLRYPTAVLSYAGITEGTFLDEEGSVATTLQVAETPPGNLVIGTSRLGDVGSVTGTGVVVALEFRAQAAGSGAFSFDRNEALDITGNAQPDVTWTAGTVEVRM